MRILAEASFLVCAIACSVGTYCFFRARPRRGWFFPIAIAFALQAAWVGTVALYLRSPYLRSSAGTLLVMTCIAAGGWLWAMLTLGAVNVRAVTRQWALLLAGCGSATVIAALTVGWKGIDWITGIGAQPTTVLSRYGLAAITLALIPAACALTLGTARLLRDVGSMAGVAVATVGGVCSVSWVAASILWWGYLTTQPAASASALAAVTSVIWVLSILRRLPTARPLSPSRPFVYGAAALCLVVGYAVAARYALRLMAPLGAMLPEMLPAFAFAAGAGLVVILGSRRARHRLWVTVGRSVFRSKHDYGAVWVGLTSLVTEARSASDLLQRVSIFCRDLLCVDNVSIYLYDAAGTLRPAAFAIAGSPGPGISMPSMLEQTGLDVERTDADASADLARKLAAALVSPMRINGHRLGFIAVGEGGERLSLDDEDHLVMDYITAQVASALGLYRFGEEVADAREVGSFHRLSAFLIHDLKNLVAQQSFVLENARKFGADPEFVTDALDAFADSTNRMRALITRLRTDESHEASAERSCDVMDLVREITRGPRLTLPGGCSVRLIAPDGMAACHVRADRSALTQVFTNLIVNAVESLPGDRGEVQIAFHGGDRFRRIEVSDNGCGIPEAFLREHLFRPFRSTKKGGTGIGLYQCKVVVEAAGGSISIASRPGGGTTVSVQLRAAAAPDEKESQRNEPGVRDGQADVARG